MQVDWEKEKDVKNESDSKIGTQIMKTREGVERECVCVRGCVCVRERVR